MSLTSPAFTHSCVAQPGHVHAGAGADGQAGVPGAQVAGCGYGKSFSSVTDSVPSILQRGQHAAPLAALLHSTERACETLSNT